MFLPPAARKKPAESMQSRLRHLESLVKDAMNAQVPVNNKDNVPGYRRQDGLRNNVGARSKPSLDGQAQTLGRVQIPFAQTQMIASKAVDSGSSGQVIQSITETTYVGATHWAAILEDVSLLLYPFGRLFADVFFRSKKLKVTLMK